MTFCTIKESKEFQVLREIMRMLRGHRLGNGSKILEKSEELAEKRWKEAHKRLKEYLNRLRKREEVLFYNALDNLLRGKSVDEVVEEISRDEERRELREEVESLEWEPKGRTGKDFEDLLRDYEKKGYIDFEGRMIKITSKGARILGLGFLRIIMENLTKKDMGMHRFEEVGHGPRLSKFSRKYELGDVYERINIKRTFLNALESNRKIDQLKTEDFEVYESLHQAKMNVGIIIDESGSMNYGNKINAAIETTLALSELMRTNYSEDTLKIFTFSEYVKEITPWDVPNISMPMRYTDIRTGMRAYRKAVAHEDGDMQAFLITDSEPNFENGKYVGFRQAALGVLREASRYRSEGITLNLIMLDRAYHLKELASMMAKRNLGRIVFTDPENLKEAIIEDYLIKKREKLLNI